MWLFLVICFHQVGSMSLVRSWWTWSRAQWTLWGPAPSVRCSDLTTLSLVSLWKLNIHSFIILALEKSNGKYFDQREKKNLCLFVLICLYVLICLFKKTSGIVRFQVMFHVWLLTVSKLCFKYGNGVSGVRCLYLLVTHRSERGREQLG